MLKLKDILDKKVLYFRDTDCRYYWDYKYIVEIDNDNVCLINHNGSYSGYYPESIEFVDKEFVSAFFEKRWEKEMDSFDYIGNKTLRDYVGDIPRDYNSEINQYANEKVILIDTNYVQEEYNKFKELIKD